MNKRSDRKQQGVTFRVSLVRLLPEPMTCPSCIITQLPCTHTAAPKHISLSLSLSGRYFVHKRNLPLQNLSYALASMQYLEMDLNQVTLDQKAWED
jgi:hypothetical protein